MKKITHAISDDKHVYGQDILYWQELFRIVCIILLWNSLALLYSYNYFLRFIFQQ